MSGHLVVGAGVVGTALARVLADAGLDVTVVSRSGRGPNLPGVRLVAADASAVDSLLAASATADAIHNCANPPYHRWPQEWPPLAEAMLQYAERTGAVLVTCSNLYGYGPYDGPLTEDLPLASTGIKGRVRAGMWRDALAAHEAGRIRATEVRGSDYLCAGQGSRMGDRVVPRILAGKKVQLIGALDQPHTWTSPTDVAGLMAVAARDERAWGRAWHVPSNPPRTQRQVVEDLAAAAGVPAVAVATVPGPVRWALGLVNPVVRELAETDYQFERPFILNDSAVRETFGLVPTPWDELLRRQIADYREA